MNRVLCNAPRSGIRLITELAYSKFNPDELIFLGYGQPDLPADPRISEYIAEAGRLELTKYTPNKGMEELREAIVEDLFPLNSSLDIEDIFVTCGATHALSAAIGSIINPGDEVLTPDPGYPNYPLAILHYGGLPVFYQLKAETKFKPSLSDIVSKASNKTRAIIVNSPSNPTGSMIDKQVFDDLVEWCNNNKVWLISDEVYSKLTYTSSHYSPISSKSPWVISIYSFSKNYNLCGLRVGYLVNIDPLFQKTMLNSQELYISCASSIGQYVALKALKNLNDYIESSKRRYIKRLRATKDCSYIVSDPCGAFYLLVDISSQDLNSVDFSVELLNTSRVAVAPGLSFGPTSDKYIRISLIAHTDKIIDGLSKIENLLRPT